MYILITNDDGYQSPGLAALRRALAPLGEVAVVAPDRNWSAAGHYRKLFDPLRAWEGSLIDGSPAMICDGTPADCVALAVMGLLPKKPDLVVSGINLGANLGSDLLYSGTVAAAMEGIIFGLPAIAVSQNNGHRSPQDFRAAEAAVTRIVQQVCQRQIPAGVLLNINIPDLPPEQVRGIQVARLGQRTYRDELVVRHDPRGRPYYWIGGAEPEDLHEEGTDVAAIATGYVSVTPVHMDLTSHKWMDEVRNWGLE
ncbi:stationary-phase survival protein SurE [Oscillochloris trichoides DG-6]|uniref:5'-nucleotidase SurE n=1 Tax=Oscillochloris trichoides DG-6 TaxID=765420 RepID=E1IAM6_9CHLR|nr:5'/3'-nucleotidase SurE [Oscillochloris trichoides]EFO81800.1 stationary-phase survival protein SurE [Oscillochloris trichoides DG-6]